MRGAGVRVQNGLTAAPAWPQASVEPETSKLLAQAGRSPQTQKAPGHTACSVALYELKAGGELWQHALTASVAQAGKFLQQGLTAPDTHSDTKRASWRTLFLQHCH